MEESGTVEILALQALPEEGRGGDCVIFFICSSYLSAEISLTILLPLIVSLIKFIFCRILLITMNGFGTLHIIV